MPIREVQIQGADGTTHIVPIDTITGQTFAIPLYKLTIGGIGEDDGVISATNPLPTLLRGLDDDEILTTIRVDSFDNLKVVDQSSLEAREQHDEIIVLLKLISAKLNPLHQDNYEMTEDDLEIN